MVVAGDEQHAAVLGRSRKIHVLEDIAKAVDARTFALPHVEYAVVIRIDLTRVRHIRAVIIWVANAIVVGIRAGRSIRADYVSVFDNDKWLVKAASCLSVLVFKIGQV